MAGKLLDFFPEQIRIGEEVKYTSPFEVQFTHAHIIGSRSNLQRSDIQHGTRANEQLDQNDTATTIGVGIYLRTTESCRPVRISSTCVVFVAICRAYTITNLQHLNLA